MSSEQLLEGISNTTLITVTSLTLVASSYLVYTQFIKARHSKDYLKLDKMLIAIVPIMNTLIAECESYYETKYSSDSQEDKQYRNNYYQEELLKVLLKIDAVEVVDVQDPIEKDELKGRRKMLIKKVQSVMKEIEQKSK